MMTMRDRFFFSFILSVIEKEAIIFSTTGAVEANLPHWRATITKTVMAGCQNEAVNGDVVVFGTTSNNRRRAAIG